MQSIKKLLTTRLSILTPILDGAKDYLSKTKDFIISIDASKYKNYESAVTNLPKLITDVSNKFDRPCADMSSKLEILGDVADDIETIDIMSLHLYELLTDDRYLKIITYNMSQTYLYEVQNRRDSLAKAVSSYRMDEHVEKFVQLLDEEINPKSNVATIVEFVEQSNKINKFTINLIKITLPHTNNSVKHRINKYIEEAKDVVLETPERRRMIDRNDIQNTISRCGLVPVTAFMTLSNLFNYIKIKYSQEHSIDENLVQLENYVVLDRLSKSPIEFNIKSVLSTKYIMKHDLMTNPKNGLNKKILERFNTAKLLPTGENLVASVKNKIKIKSDATWCYVLDTINGELFRFLGINWDDYQVPVSSIQNIINGVAPRPYVYNQICEPVILAKCRDDTIKPLVEEYEIMTKKAGDGSVKSKVVEGLVDSIQHKITTSPPQNNMQLHVAVLDRDEINRIIEEKLTHSSGQSGKGAVEYTITYIINLNVILREFHRHLEGKFHAMKPPATVYGELKGKNLLDELIGTITDIVKAAADELDRTKLWEGYDKSLKEHILDKKYIVV